MTVYFAAPTYRVMKADLTDPTHADDLQTALNRAQPGDEVHLLPGRYVTPVVFGGSGEEGALIRIRPAGKGEVILDGGRTREQGRNGMMDPLDGDFAFLRLFRASHLVIEGLSFENCWPTAIYMRGCHHITLRNCTGTGSRFFAYARQFDTAPCHDLLLEKIRWVQDPDFDMWDGRVTWPQVKGAPGHYDASFFNGAMFGSFDIQGNVTIRDCDISHAFNAIRMDMRERHIDPRGPEIGRNRNVAIYNNRIAFVRDNAVEPEAGAQNWYVYNNSFYNIHATFSTDAVAMRDVFYVGNTILNDRRPGLPGQLNQGGKIFKFLGPEDKAPGETPRPRRGLWSLFNSVQTRTAYAKKGRTSEWNDGYTMLGLYAVNYPEDQSKARVALDRIDWNDRIRVFGMISTEKDFPGKYKDGNVSGQGDLEAVFDLPGFSRDLSLPLGGWDGELPRCKDLPDLRSEELVIERAEGPDLVFPAGLIAGAHPIEVFGLEGWPGFDTGVGGSVA